MSKKVRSVRLVVWGLFITAANQTVLASDSASDVKSASLDISPPAIIDKSNPEFNVLKQQTARAQKGEVSTSHLLPYTAKNLSELTKEYEEKKKTLKDDFNRAIKLSKQPPQNLVFSYKASQNILKEEMLSLQKRLKKSKKSKN